MFISKAEKSNLYKLIADLQLRLCTLERAAISQPKSAENIEHIKHERKKAYSREYYYRKRAEKLAAEKKNAQQGFIDVKDGVPVTPPFVENGAA